MSRRFSSQTGTPVSDAVSAHANVAEVVGEERAPNLALMLAEPAPEPPPGSGARDLAGILDAAKKNGGLHHTLTSPSRASPGLPRTKSAEVATCTGGT